MSKVTDRYFQIEAENPGFTVLYRIGEFYELFGSSAEKAADILGMVLTSRGSEKMCGFPVSALDTKIASLLQAGCKIILREQDENGQEISRIVTPGTAFEEQYCESGSPCSIMSVVRVNTMEDPGFALSWIDLREGRGQYATTDDIMLIASGVSPKEILLDKSSQYLKDSLSRKFSCAFTYISEFSENIPLYETGTFFEKQAVCLLYEALRRTGKANSVLSFQRFRSEEVLMVDEAALTSLEVLKSESGYGFSLLGSFGKTFSSFGNRMLLKYLAFPSVNLFEIECRLDAVEMLVNCCDIANEIESAIRSCGDAGRSLAKITGSRGSPQDLSVIRSALIAASFIAHKINDLSNVLSARSGGKEFFRRIFAHLRSCAELKDILVKNLRSCVREASIKEGGYINPKADARLMEAFKIKDGFDVNIARLVDRYKIETGVKSISLAKKKGFGFVLEVKSSDANKLRSFPDFQYCGSLKNIVRFKTDDLTSIENELLRASADISAIELDVFHRLRKDIIKKSEDITVLADSLAKLDVILTFARVARERKYVRPQITDGRDFEIKQGRHPVLDLSSNFFQPNDIDLSDKCCWLITAPNASGKSTFMRQNALIAMMAHAGSFVPANYAKIGLIDRIETRMGFHDAICEGKSTFFIEMEEGAKMLRRATERSLLIVDEIGRGTSAAEGEDIARAFLEEILHSGARSMFATHFYSLADEYESAISVEVITLPATEEEDGKIKFSRKVVRGKANQAFALFSAAEAGMPESFLKRAAELMKKRKELEYNEKELT